MLKIIKVNGFSSCFDDTGTGKVVVLLHGFLESHAIWSYFIAELSKNFRVISIDLPGYGMSELPGDNFSMEMAAETIIAVLDHLEIYECVIVGHSMGGYVALAFAEMFNSCVKGLGLFHSTALADSPEAMVNRERMIQFVEKDRTGFIRQFFPNLFSEQNRIKLSKEVNHLSDKAATIPKLSVVASLLAMKSRKNRLHVLKSASFPVMFIGGHNDRRIPVKTIISQSTLPADCEVHLLEGVGHMGFLEAADETLELCRNFVRKCYSKN